MALRDRVNTLVLNAGSSSQKIALFPAEADPKTVPSPIWEAAIEWHDDQGRGTLTVSTPGEDAPYHESLEAGSGRSAVIAHALSLLWSGPRACLSAKEEIAAVGHRVVHGGAEYRVTTRITETVRETLTRLIPLAPTHTPAALEGIAVVTELLGATVPQFAAFDTAFHSTLPDPAAIYPGPYSWWEKGIRRYGFHGISHRYCAERAAQLLERPLKELRIITCHLGNGCSLAAIREGKSIDTTMGFTPMEGLMMGTRSGSIDPGVLLYLQQEQRETPAHLSTLLNKESGLKGVSGLSSDMREIMTAREQGNERARLAFDTFIYRLCWHIGALLPALGGLDVLVFTGGIGEHSADVRALTCEKLGFVGVQVDTAKNIAMISGDRDISRENSPVRVLVLTAQEDASIAHECQQLLG